MGAVHGSAMNWRSLLSQDEAGSFLAKDRRGNLHEIPLMSLSIGVVTNQHRKFEHTARVSELATEMKSYAKTFPGSVFVVDRRSDLAPDAEGAQPAAAPGTAEDNQVS